jgi:glycosyltransferase involved in cell wall biosynthesis
VRNRYGTDVRIAMIPNAVDVEYWSAANASAARASLDLPPGACVAAWHGRIEIEPKGLDVLLRAWDAIVRDDRFLLIVGGGGDAAEFREMVAARKNVRWTSSFVGDPAAIRTLLSAADVYVFPSRREGFPVSPIEALAASLPVVASDAPGLREIVGSGDDAAGIIVPSGDVAATAAAIETLFADPAARARARERAVARAQLFGLDAVGRQLRAFFFPLRGGRE